MKKKILCCLLAAIMMLMAIPAFADQQNYNAGYSTPVRHYFSIEFNKNSSQRWVRFTDDATESYFVDTSNGNSVTSGYHYTRLTNQSGKTIVSKQTISFSGLGNFDPSGSNALLDCVKIRIDNPNYETNTAIRLKTQGKIIYSKLSV